MSNNHSESAHFPHIGIFLTNISENTWHFLLPAAHEHRPALQSVQCYSHPCRHKPKRWICPSKHTHGRGEITEMRIEHHPVPTVQPKQGCGSHSPRYLLYPHSPPHSSHRPWHPSSPRHPQLCPVLQHGFELLRFGPGQKVP